MTFENANLSKQEVYSLSYHPEALHLLAFVKISYANTTGEFKIPFKLCCDELDWEETEVRRAIKTLMREGYIERTYLGGGVRGAHHYIWGKAVCND